MFLSLPFQRVMLVMEYVPGGSLFKQMGDDGVPKEKIAKYFE